MKAIVDAFNLKKKKALGAFSVFVQLCQWIVCSSYLNWSPSHSGILHLYPLLGFSPDNREQRTGCLGYGDMQHANL